MAKKLEDEVIITDAAEEVGEPRVYELGFHLDPELPTEEVKKSYQAVRETITEKGSVVAEGEPEKIQLAYTISRQDVAGRRDFDSAYFSWIAYEATPANHADILSAVGANPHLIRFIDLLTTKDAARHAVEMRDIARTMPERVEDTETVAGAELDAVLENVTI